MLVTQSKAEKCTQFRSYALSNTQKKVNLQWSASSQSHCSLRPAAKNSFRGLLLGYRSLFIEFQQSRNSTTVNELIAQELDIFSQSPFAFSQTFWTISSATETFYRSA